MKTPKIRKKGLFFTVSIIFLIPAIITIWTLANVQVNMEQSFIMDRIYDLSTSVESGIRDIFYFYNCNISMEKSDSTINITFIENITANKTTWGKEFNTTIGNFKSFIESEESSIKINLTALQQKENPFVIEPYNVTYSKNWSSRGNISNVTIKIVPVSLNFRSYDVEVNTTNVWIINVSSTFGAAGSFSFSVTAVDNYGHKYVRKANINPSNTHQVQILFNGSSRINVSLMNNNLEIWSNLQNNTLISTKIDGFDRNYDRTRIKIFRDVINVSFPEFKAEKIGSVYISEQQ